MVSGKKSFELRADHSLSCRIRMGRYTLSLSIISSWSDAYAIPTVILCEELLKKNCSFHAGY
jgi:hypothetical protein